MITIKQASNYSMSMHSIYTLFVYARLNSLSLALSSTVPCISQLEKRKQRLQLGKYLHANGLQTKPVSTFLEKRGCSSSSTQRIQSTKVI